jgi:hypothetical protein
MGSGTPMASDTITNIDQSLSQWTFTSKLPGIPIEFYPGLVIMLILWNVSAFTSTPLVSNRAGSTLLAPSRRVPPGDRGHGLQLLGADNYVQQLFYGAALVLAVVLSRPLGGGDDRPEGC